MRASRSFLFRNKKATLQQRYKTTLFFTLQSNVHVLVYKSYIAIIQYFANLYLSINELVHFGFGEGLHKQSLLPYPFEYIDVIQYV